MSAVIDFARSGACLNAAIILAGLLVVVELRCEWRDRHRKGGLRHG